MEFGIKKLSSAVRLALSLSAAIAMGSSVAFAQDPTAQVSASQPATQKASTLPTVVVTGSHIRRVDLETASPVVTIDRAAIQASGKLTLGDLVQQLPAMTGGNVNPQVNNGGGGGDSSINMRGLGSNRTLILVDGQRLLSVDPNAIPVDAVERIEVLTSGASAVYGSDAIGGVVNFILRKDYQGATFTTNFGQSDHNDGAQRGYTFTFGQTSDKGSIMAGINYNKQDGVEAANRNFSKDALTLKKNGPVIGGSPSTPNDYLQLPTRLAGAFPGGCTAASGYVALNPGGNSTVLSPANYHCFTQSDKYNYAATNLIMTPQERAGGFINGDYRLGEHASAYMSAIYEKTSSNFQLAPGVYGTDTTGASIDAGNAFNPTHENLNGTDGLAFRTRLTPNGLRSAKNGRTDAQINTGLKGDFAVMDKNWNWDVGLNYGHQSLVTMTAGLANQNVLYTGPSTLNASGIATCPAGVDPVACQFNPFNINAPGSVAAANAAKVIAPSNAYQIEKSWHADFNGELFSLPAGAVLLALGAEYRTKYANVVPDTGLLLNSSGSCIMGSQCQAGLSGGYNAKDVYAEAFIPVLKGLPGAQSLNVTIGDRYSKVNTFGSTNNFKFALEWKPFDDLLLRGTMEQVFRAPNVYELFLSGSDAPSLQSDPCTGYTGAPAGSPLALACKYVPTNGKFTNNFLTSEGQASAITEGAAVAGFPIKPESGKTFDLGAVYSASWAPGLSTTIDFWHVYLNNTIASVGMQSVLNLCAAGQTAFCPYIKRVSSGQNAGQLGQGFVEPTANLGSTSTGGIDWSANYKLPQFSFGQFNLGVNATYLKYFTQQTAPGTPGNVTFNDAGHFLPAHSAQAAACPGGSICLFPRWRAQDYVDWQQGNWSASWRMRYIGRFQNGGAVNSGQNTSPNGVPGTVLKYGATVYNDMSIGYNIEPYNTRLDLGVNNLFDKQPPMLYANNTVNANTDPSDFDLLGRYFWGRVTVKF